MTEDLTPWINKAEWMKVSECLYSSKLEQQRWATERLAIWKIRSYPKLPAELDATEALARARYLDSLVQNTSNYAEMQDVVKLQSIALVRFIKLIDELGKKKGLSSVNNAAKLLNVPRWIADLRHDITHYNIPPVRILREGISFALNWLKSHYWNQYLEVTDDGTSENSFGDDETNAKDLIDNFYKQQCEDPLNYRKIKYITNDMRYALRHNIYTFTKILASYMVPKEEKLIKILKDKEVQFVKSESTVLPKSHLIFWIPVLQLYNTKEKFCLLFEYLLSLSKLTSDSFRHRLVAAWLIKFLKFKKRYYFKLKNPKLNWSWLLKKALVCENKYSSEFLPLILQKMKVQIPEEKKQDLMALVAIRLGKTLKLKSKPPKDHHMYTLLDLEKVRLRETKFIEGEPINWQICTDNINWENWPIGCLPGIDFDSLHSTYDKVKESSIPEY